MGSANANRALRIAEESQDNLITLRKDIVTAKEHAELFRELAEEHRAADRPHIGELFEEVRFAYERLAAKKRRGGKGYG